MPAVLAFLACLLLAACDSPERVRPIMLQPACPQAPSGPGYMDVSQDSGHRPERNLEAEDDTSAPGNDKLVARPACRPLLRM